MRPKLHRLVLAPLAAALTLAPTSALAASPEEAAEGAIDGLAALVPPEVQPYVDIAVDIATALVIFIIGIVVAGWAAALIRRSLGKRDLDGSLVGFLASLGRWLVLAAAVIAALETVGVQTTSLVALLGSAGIAIGLALQGNLAHFASGVMILMFKPYRVDEYIEAGGKEGWVKEVGLFTTQLLTYDNETIIIPNGAATGSTIINYSRAGTRRVAVDVGVAYGTKVAPVLEILEKAARNSEYVEQDKPIVIAFVGLGASSIDFKILAHCTPANYADMLHTVRTGAYELLEEAGIEIPFMQVVVHQAPGEEG